MARCTDLVVILKHTGVYGKVKLPLLKYDGTKLELSLKISALDGEQRLVSRCGRYITSEILAFYSLKIRWCGS